MKKSPIIEHSPNDLPEGSSEKSVSNAAVNGTSPLESADVHTNGARAASTITPPLDGPTRETLRKPLERLLLAYRVRELADYPRPVTVRDLGHFSWMFGAIAGRAYSTASFLDRVLPGKTKKPALIALDATVLILTRLLLHRLMFWKLALNTGKTLMRNAYFSSRRYHARPAAELSVFVRSTDREEQLIQMCLMLRVANHHGACVEYLLQRLHSGLPDQETRRWLSFLLAETGDEESADLIFPGRDATVTGETELDRSKMARWSSDRKNPSTLKFGVVLPTMFDTEIFRRSLLSLLESDFPGEVVVVEEGNNPNKVCEEFCSRLPVRYVKNQTWTGTSGVANLGIDTLDEDTDIIIFAHNDLLWPPHWYEQLAVAWDRVYDVDKVGVIYLSVLEFFGTSDPMLKDMFLRGNYEELISILSATRDSSVFMGSVGNVQLNDKDRGKLFGIAMSNWEGAFPQITVGEPCVVTFSRQTWSDLGKFDVSMGWGILAELLYHDLNHRKWDLRINNTPLVHFTRSDTDLANIGEVGKAKIAELRVTAPRRFEEKHGWNYPHITSTYNGETLVIHADEITEAANENRFEDVDYIFDEYFDRINEKTLSDCELLWCPARATCKYIEPARTTVGIH